MKQLDRLSGRESSALFGLRAAQELAHKTTTDAGWYKDPVTGDDIDRQGLMDDKLPHRDGREVELADCIIHILNTATALRLDVAGAIIEKNRFNKSRAAVRNTDKNARHGANRAGKLLSTKE